MLTVPRMVLVSDFIPFGPSSLQSPSPDKGHRVREHSLALNYLGFDPASSEPLPPNTIIMKRFVLQNGKNDKDFVHFHPAVPPFNRAIKDSIKIFCM